MAAGDLTLGQLTLATGGQLELVNGGLFLEVGLQPPLLFLGQRLPVFQHQLRHPPLLPFEGTGAYHGAMERALAKAGLPMVKVNPRQVRRFAEALGKLAKTDRLDAALLVRMGTRALFLRIYGRREAGGKDNKSR